MLAPVRTAAAQLPAHQASTWAGDAACFLLRPSPPLAVPGTTPRPGTSGTWLKASTPARLRLVPAGGSNSEAGHSASATLLELSLPKRLLLRVDLSEAARPGADGAPRLLRDAAVLIVPRVSKHSLGRGQPR
jgi:hypothetical protein